MILVFGTRLYGTVRRCGDTRVATRFFHLSFLPVVPLATHAVVAAEPTDGGSGGYRYLKARLDPLSIAAAYLRTWGLLLGLFVVLHAVGTFAEAMDQRLWVDLVTAPLLVFATVGALVAAFVSLGRLSQAERQQQEVYARFVGAPLDPALLDDRRPEVRRQVLEALGERAAALGLLGYRNDGAGGADWTGIALSPAVRDLDYLEAALTLARLDWAEAPRAERTARRQLHAGIWSRLLSLRASAAPVAGQPLPAT